MLCLSLAIASPLGAQEPALPPEKLTVLVLQGQGAVNFIPDRRGATPVVEVRDRNALPVEGAEVEFTLPASGPGGVFTAGGSVAKLRTNADGQAAASFAVNDKPGPFQIRVRASIGDRKGSALISQVNSVRPPEAPGARKRPLHRSWKLWAVLAGVAAAGAVVAVTRGSGSSSGPTITIAPGSPTVGHP